MSQKRAQECGVLHYATQQKILKTGGVVEKGLGGLRERNGKTGGQGKGVSERSFHHNPEGNGGKCTNDIYIIDWSRTKLGAERSGSVQNIFTGPSNGPVH